MKKDSAPSGAGIVWYVSGAFISILRNRSLYGRLVGRDIHNRYKGSVLGIVWTLLNPLSLLVVFSFVFGLVLKARWGIGGRNFTLVLFSGLILFTFMAECVNRGPTLILQNANYVKKVVFPLELLPAVVLGSATINLVLSMAILMIGELWYGGGLPVTWIAMPLVIFPLILLTYGWVLFLASLGVFLRDLAQLTGILTLLLMYLGPILFPVDMVPSQFRPWLNLNPLTFPVTQFRAIALNNQWPDWSGLCWYTLIAISITTFGFWWFWRTKNGFADVV
ncbi:lipopolysaccharide transport system permease protein [Rhodanobacter sp. ANJX3]|uniref:ABC transporter permease n=1 Tax=unclassified Rhodanobacter TaxID=2621553 RepID=UPI0015CD8C7E|nr:MULTISPECIES: ABC transporter permease [unclassified Rhodanobacter]MBB5360830.1 lipopolysaccharide transport system permease protein [Rhodanobacter sp. ANJX3]NYE30217.1 lipopolysaccharide transport system permease protein [Rhodanobacter sp. K2T2]